MTRLTLTYGIIIGTIIIAVVLISMNINADGSGHLAGLEWLGYLSQILAFSIIFVAVKKYRDQQLGGVIKFGKAFRVGLGITVNAAIIYVAAWEVNLSLTDYAFIGNYTDLVIEGAKADGVSGAELDALISQMESMTESYSNPFLRVLITFAEILPTGIVISLICAAILRKSDIIPETEQVTA